VRESECLLTCVSACLPSYLFEGIAALGGENEEKSDIRKLMAGDHCHCCTLGCPVVIWVKDWSGRMELSEEFCCCDV
jgi:hypothetical protein